MTGRLRISIALPLLVTLLAGYASGVESVSHPFEGVTYIVRTETAPRNLRMHLVIIDLATPGLRFEVTPPSGPLETKRERTLDFLREEHAQIAINAHFFTPFPSDRPDADLIGFAASEGRVYSGFEVPEQSYAIVANAPAINIDQENHASIVHDDPRFADGKHIREQVQVWNAVSGSAQIISDGVETVPTYIDAQHPYGLLKPGGHSSAVGGSQNYSNAHSWYDRATARNIIGLTKDNRALVLFTVDGAGGSQGMTAKEAADLLIREYGVYNALHLDGGGSMTMAMEDPASGDAAIVTTSADVPEGRVVGSNLAVFAPQRSSGSAGSSTHPRLPHR